MVPDSQVMGCSLQREKDLFNALMVYDVTLACLEPFIRPEMANSLCGQIKAAKDAYREVVGEEPFQLRRGQ